MKSFLILIAIILVNPFSIFAQDLDPVNWTYSATQLDNDSIAITIHADIDDNWYLYSQDIGDGGPVPTSIRFDDSFAIPTNQVIIEHGELIEKHDPFFDMNIKKYAKSVDFVSTIHAKAESVSGFIRYMTCDAQRCLPPKEIPFTAVVNKAE